MVISLFNIRITLQQNAVVTDEIGNRKNAWTDYYSCYATASGENGSLKGVEEEAAGIVTVHPSIDFTVRWCKALSDVTSDGYRIMFDGEPYNIIGIDHMNFKRKSLKFRCQKEAR